MERVLKFVYSEKATKFCEISTLLLSYVVPVKSKVEISHNFVAFSEYMNLNKNTEKIMTRKNFIAIVFASCNKKNLHFLFIPNIGNATEKKRLMAFFCGKSPLCVGAISQSFVSRPKILSCEIGES